MDDNECGGLCLEDVGVRLLSESIGVVSVVVDGLVTVAFVDRRWNVVAARLNDWLAVAVDGVCLVLLNVGVAAAAVAVVVPELAAVGCCGMACFQPCIL